MKHHLPKYGIILTLLAIALVAGFIMLHHGGGAEKENLLYTCPMHPQIVKDKPGDCPICGMKLVPVKKDEPVEGGQAGHRPRPCTGPP